MPLSRKLFRNAELTWQYDLFPLIATFQEWETASVIETSYISEKDLLLWCVVNFHNHLRSNVTLTFRNRFLCCFAILFTWDVALFCIEIHDACWTDIIKRHRYDWHSKLRSNLINAASLLVLSCLVGKETARINAVKESTCSSWGNLHNRILQEAKLQCL